MNEQKRNESVSLLFMICSSEAEVITVEEELFIAIPVLDSVVIYFSDRPYRFAGRLQGGIDEFYHMYKDSDFQNDPPNVTFTGEQDGTSSISYSVFETGTPKLESDYVLLPYNSILSGSQALPTVRYIEVSLVIDPGLFPFVAKGASRMIGILQEAEHTSAKEASRMATNAAEGIKDRISHIKTKTNDGCREVSGNAEEVTQKAKDGAIEAARAAASHAYAEAKKAGKSSAAAAEDAKTAGMKAGKATYKGGMKAGKEGAEGAWDGGKWLGEAIQKQQTFEQSHDQAWLGEEEDDPHDG